MADTPSTDMRPVADFLQTGMLWEINRLVLHPRGYAMVLHVSDDLSEVLGWSIQGNASEPWSFAEDDDKDGFQRFQKFLKSLPTI